MNRGSSRDLADLRWDELFRRRTSRRDLIRAGAAAAALVAMGGALPARRGDRRPRFRRDPFTLGVASGDPHPDGVVLWTRLDGPTMAEADAPEGGVPVRWEVAEDEGFRRIVQAGESLARPELGYSVHAEVQGLEPSRVYHYRFDSGGVASTVGRARTAPAVGAPTDRLAFAFCCCQNWEDGFYTAYRHMLEEDVDLVVHLGDYIYEGGPSRWAVRPNYGEECRTLDQYRARFAQYRGDEDLQAVHAAFSWVMTWDDHDVDNNYAGAVPQDDQDPREFLLRRAAAYQAYYEFMPLRRSSAPSGPDMPIYRRLGFGDLLDLSVLDTRQYRDDQACGDRFQPDCDERFLDHRSLLGGAQERWLLDGLEGSAARWNVVAQQVMMAPMMEIRREMPMHSMDTWDGYPHARRRLLDAFASRQVASPVVITGDVHSSLVADLHLDGEGSPVVGTELAATSITTNGDGWDIDPAWNPTVDLNPHLRYHDERRGYVRCDVDPERVRATFRAVPWVSTPGAPLETRATWVVERGRPGAVREG